MKEYFFCNFVDCKTGRCGIPVYEDEPGYKDKRCKRHFKKEQKEIIKKGKKFRGKSRYIDQIKGFNPFYE